MTDSEQSNEMSAYFKTPAGRLWIIGIVIAVLLVIVAAIFTIFLPNPSEMPSESLIGRIYSSLPWSSDSEHLLEGEEEEVDDNDNGDDGNIGRFDPRDLTERQRIAAEINSQISADRAMAIPEDILTRVILSVNQSPDEIYIDEWQEFLEIISHINSPVISLVSSPDQSAFATRRPIDYAEMSKIAEMFACENDYYFVKEVIERGSIIMRGLYEGPRDETLRQKAEAYLIDMDRMLLGEVPLDTNTGEINIYNVGSGAQAVAAAMVFTPTLASHKLLGNINIQVGEGAIASSLRLSGDIHNRINHWTARHGAKTEQE